jgi:hypothetical protein
LYAAIRLKFMAPRVLRVAAWCVWAALVGCGTRALSPDRHADAGPTSDERPARSPEAIDASSTEPAPVPNEDAADDAASTPDPSVDAAAEAEAREDVPDAGGLPVIVGPHPYRALAIAVGLAHTCVVLEDHRVKCWGEGGLLGNGDAQPRGRPGDMGDALPFVDLGTGRTARAISAGRYSTCALLDDGSAKCWGLGGISGHATNVGDQPGQMGDALAAMPVPAGRTVARVAAGVSWASAILDDGSAATWQGGKMATFPPGRSPVVQLVHGSESRGTLVLFENGQPGTLDPNLGLMGLASNAPEIFVAGGRADLCDVFATGRVVCTSDSRNSRWSDTTVATRIATGLGFSCVLTKDGDVRCRGSGIGGCESSFPQNTYWCTGPRADDFSAKVELGQRAVDVQAGDLWACALVADGSVRCWGGSDVCVPYDRGGVMGYDCLEPAPPPPVLGGGIALETVAGQTKYGPWRAVDLGTFR